MDYIYKKYKDEYTIENTGTLVIDYKIQIKDCDSLTDKFSGSIQPGKIFTLPITFLDGIYVITLSTEIEEEILSDIFQFNNTLLNFIDGTEEVLCGCKKCNDCEDCNKCETSLKTLNYALAFFHVNNPKYNDYLLTISESLECNYSQEIMKVIGESTLSGKEEIKNVTYLNIALHYLTFFNLDLAQAFDSDEAIFIKEKYKSSKILKCIRKLGIDVDDFNEQLFINMQVYYWQLDNTQDDIDDVIPLINSVYLNDKPVLLFSEFEDGEIISYTTVGRAVFAIKETDVINFVLSDSLNNDITDEFDTHYFPSMKTALFVSKNPFSISNVYFKFKKLTFTP